MKKIIVLGASGQLGQEWQHTFTDPEVVLLPYNSGQLDITMENQLRDELTEQQPDIVVNCAAYTDVDGAEENRDKAWHINVEAVSGLAELAEQIGFTLVHYSTDYVFPGKSNDRQRHPKGYPESLAANPINFYGQTKWEGEKIIRKKTDQHLILRVSWLCGNYGSNFVKTMLRLGQGHEELQVVNEQWGSPTFTGNVVRNSWKLLQNKRRGTFHISSKGLITWHHFAKAIFSRAGIKVDLEAVRSEHFPTEAERPRFSKLKTSRLAGIKGTILEDWKTGLDKLLYQIEYE